MRDLEDVLNSHDLLILLLIELPTSCDRRARCKWVHYKSSRFSATCRARRNSRSSANTWGRKTRGPRAAQGGVREGGRRQIPWQNSGKTGEECVLLRLDNPVGHRPACLGSPRQQFAFICGLAHVMCPSGQDSQHRHMMNYSATLVLVCTLLQIAWLRQDSKNQLINTKFLKSEWEKMWGKENERKKSCVGSDR